MPVKKKATLKKLKKKTKKVKATKKGVAKNRK